ncbi:hypothetical protein IAQ61_006729 [Plenodomus lingam]|uniref:Pentatricopeptide repeat domain-containing protein n=1 Tax=Leptosphaeria maculans (strain JN3 / isolate v23.1.3 / race Av1-4-5-6-7-8) TaxID=985895 RepID=E5ACE1_LEPMJ|nr:hypothetical protein LEMA_P009300.1 [Plenodomus lingam JN3]KAH9869522.1 hypothetical protein IAQ61_006729 [Plenodomus lingam]CBY02143.1 hypothetical protein LEMA_P009300.1 [Plenodomus lingam JN3]
MPPAIDRLLASPSALRILRSIVNAAEFPAACATTTATACCTSAISTRCEYSTHKKASSKQKWRRWHEKAGEIVERDQVRRFLEAESHSLEDDSSVLPHGKGDDAAWANALAQVERLKGMTGVESLWYECQLRGYRLPTKSSPDAEYLWSTFSKHPRLVHHVIDHAAAALKETDTTYPRLYHVVMGYWLPRKPKAALELHHRMLVTLRLRRIPLREMARAGQATFAPNVYEVLLDMYRNSNERDLYDVVVPTLIEKGHFTMARRWHSLCTFRNDLPSEAVMTNPVIQIFTAEASALSNAEPHFNGGGTSMSTNQAKVEHRRYNQDLMRRLLGRDTAPVRFEDSFCARMFATRTFPPASIIQGLAMVGVNEIGPQAVLAMAARTQPMEELPQRFEELRAVGIALQGCVFSLALEKFAKEQKWQLVRSMLESDQHPDVFGDADVQRKLLHFYLDREDYVQVQRTLAILTLFHSDPSTESWNLLLQLHIERSELQQFFRTLQEMRVHGIMVTHESILAIKGLLRRRQRGRRPVASNYYRFDELRFIARIYISILESGTGVISPTMWHEIFRRFGMLGRFRELRRLLYRLLCWYAPRSKAQFMHLPKSPFLDAASAKLRAAHPERKLYFNFPAQYSQELAVKHPIRQLLPQPLLQGLIVWGFRAGILPNAHWEQSLFNSTLAKKHYRKRLIRSHGLKRLDWSVGLRTVVQLRDLGVHVHRRTVLKALQAQFLNLFGTGRSSKTQNRIMETTNTKPYSAYVEEVNEIWGSTLIVEPQKIGEMVGKAVWHPRLRRRMNHRSQGSSTLRAGRNKQTGAGVGEHDNISLKELQQGVAERTEVQVSNSSENITSEVTRSTSTDDARS